MKRCKRLALGSVCAHIANQVLAVPNSSASSSRSNSVMERPKHTHNHMRMICMNGRRLVSCGTLPVRASKATKSDPDLMSRAFLR